MAILLNLVKSCYVRHVHVSSKYLSGDVVTYVLYSCDMCVISYMCRTMDYSM